MSGLQKRRLNGVGCANGEISTADEVQNGGGKREMPSGVGGGNGEISTAGEFQNGSARERFSVW